MNRRESMTARRLTSAGLRALISEEVRQIKAAGAARRPRRINESIMTRPEIMEAIDNLVGAVIDAMIEDQLIDESESDEMHPEVHNLILNAAEEATNLVPGSRG